MRLTIRLLACSMLFLAGACVEPDVMPPIAQSSLEVAEVGRQRAMAFQAHQVEYVRLQSVSDRLRIGAAPICPDLAPRYGWSVANAFSFKPDVRAIANRQYGLDDRLKGIRVTPAGPVDRAGVWPGDDIVRVNGNLLAGTGADQQFELISEAASRDGTPIHLDLERDGRKFHVDVIGAVACNLPAYLTGNQRIYAETDGKRIFVSEGMLRFVRDDNELALVVAHEMGHDVKHHLAGRKLKRPEGRTAGLALDVPIEVGQADESTEPLAVAAMLPDPANDGEVGRQLESEADYISLYMMALSGFDISHAPDFWRRVATLRPGDIAEGFTHPSTAQRFIAMDAAVREIRSKQAQGLVLRPSGD